VSSSRPNTPISRRRFLFGGACAGTSVALYGGEVERHWIELTHHDVFLSGLSPAFDGYRIAQLSDIHLDEFTEPSLLTKAIHHINGMNPDAVFITGDYVTYGILPAKLAIGSAWQCGSLLTQLECPHRYAIVGNHDVLLSKAAVIASLSANGIIVLDNAYLPIERDGARFWLAGVDDPVEGTPMPDVAIPESIHNVPHEPVVLLCHAPDYVDDLVTTPAGRALSLVLSGHTHGGQVRFPLVRATNLPPLGRKYVEGWFRFGNLQLYVNRGLGTVGVPVRFDCPPEITLFTLRSA
jgi:uncharacterized protein